MRPEPPTCPGWCNTDHDGWHVTPWAVTSTCQRTIPVDGYGVSGTVILERFTDLTDAGVDVGETVIRVDTNADWMHPEAAVLVAETVLRAADLLLEDALAA